MPIHHLNKLLYTHTVEHYATVKKMEKISMNWLEWFAGHTVKWKKERYKRISMVCYPSCKEEGDIRKYTCICLLYKRILYRKDKQKTREIKHIETIWERLYIKKRMGIGEQRWGGRDTSWNVSFWIVLIIRTYLCFLHSSTLYLI